MLISWIRWPWGFSGPGGVASRLQVGHLLSHLILLLVNVSIIAISGIRRKYHHDELYFLPIRKDRRMPIRMFDSLDLKPPQFVYGSVMRNVLMTADQRTPIEISDKFFGHTSKLDVTVPLLLCADVHMVLPGQLEAKYKKQSFLISYPAEMRVKLDFLDDSAVLARWGRPLSKVVLSGNTGIDFEFTCLLKFHEMKR